MEQDQKDPGRIRWPLRARFKPDPDALLKYFGGGLVLVNSRTGTMHVLNATASRIWELASAGNSLAEIQEAILQEYNVSKNEVSDEIDSLVSLLNKGDFLKVL